MPLWTVFRHEVVAAATNRRLQLILLATVILAVVGGTVTAQEYQDRNAQFKTRSTQLREALADGALMVPWSGDPGLRALRSPEPGSILARGLEPSIPSWWAFDPDGPVDGGIDPSQAEASQTGAVLDLEGLIRVFLSLMALALGFDSVSGDRGRGVLQAVLDQPIGSRTVLTGKLLAGATLMAVAVLIAAVTLLVTTALVAPNAIDGSLPQLVLPFCAIGLLYLATLVAAAMLIGSVAPNPALSVGAVAAAWTYVAFVGPQLTVFGSRAFVPIPSRALLEIERQRSFDARFESSQRSVGRAYREAIGDANLHVRPQPTPDQAGLAALGRQWRAEAEITRRVVEAFDKRSTDLEQDRSRVKAWFMSASPGSLLFEAVADLANTGTAARDRWRQAIWAHQEYLNKVFFDDPPRVPLYVPEDQGAGMVIINIKLHNDVRARDLASFDIAPAPWSARFRESFPALAGLLCYFVACVGLTYWTFPRTGP